MNMFTKNCKGLVKGLSIAAVIWSSQSQAAVPNEVSWMAAEKWGISHHYLAGGTLNNAYYNITDYDEWNDYVNGFDVNNYVDKVEKLGAGYVIFTITQNRGYLATTSDIYDANSPVCPSSSVTPGCVNQTGINKADYTPSRDLILDLASALDAKGIKLIVYAPSHKPDRMAGYAESTPSYPDWWIKDFVKEKSDAWGTKVAGWWFDGYWNIKTSEQANNFPIATKIHTAVTSGNANAVITFNNGGGAFTTHDKFSNFTPGETNSLPSISSSGEITGWAGNKAQWVGWTFLSQPDSVFQGWGEIDKNLKYSNSDVANRAKAISDVGAVSTWDVAINPNGSWTLDRLIQVQTIGNTTGTSADTTYSALQLVNNTSNELTYSSSGNWSTSSNRGTGAYQQDAQLTTVNDAYVEYSFTGSSIVFATSKASDQGDVEVFIDGVSKGTFSTLDAKHRQVQEIIYEAHNLPTGAHTIKVVKKSGQYMLIDVFASKGTLSNLTKINNTDANISYVGGWGTDSSRGHGDYSDDVAYTSANEEYFTYTFTGNTVKYIAPKASDQGNVEVFIDNVSQGVISTHSVTRQVQQEIFSTSALSVGSHTMKVVKKSGSYMLVDAIEYGTSTPSVTEVNNTDANITHTGSWGTSSNRGHGDHSDDVGYTSTNGDSASYTFTGTSVSYIAPKAIDQGNVEVFIDNVSQGTFNTYSLNRQVQQVIFNKANLSNGSHTIRVVKKSGAYMLLDLFKYN